MVSQKTFLSGKDKVKLENILHKGKSNVYVISFLQHLEKTYNLEDFQYDSFSVTEIHERDYNAAEAYYFCLMSILLSGDKDIFNFSKQIVHIVNKQIQRLERSMKSGIEKSFCLQSIMHIMMLLLNIYAHNNDLHNLTKTYHRFFELHSILKEYDVDGTSTDEISVMQKWYSDRLDTYLNKSDINIFINNPNLMKCFNTALHYSTDDEPCFLIGETGTGKELVARAIHNISLRRENNFWAVNCAGFTESLFESEISGVIAGAATGVETRLGAFLKACGREEDGKKGGGYYVLSGKNKNGDKIGFKIKGKDIENPTVEELKEFGGTLFLDEVNSMPVALQAKLLRIIQEKEVRVIGEDRTREFNLKIICASNKDLNDQKTPFREDLYYRISRGIIRLPALRDMKESIVDSARYLIKEISQRIDYNKKVHINKRTAEKLKSYEWPGNFRELENVLYRAIKNMIISGDSILKHNHVENLINQKKPANELERFFSNKTHSDIEKMYMGYILEKAEGNKAEAMRLSGFKSKTPIDRLLRKYKLYT